MRIRLEKRGTLVDAVEESLEGAILHGEFAAGALFPGEERLARELGVSRGTLRHAISRLVARGLLETSQGRQTRVSALGQLVTLDALLPAVLASSEEGRSRELLAGLLEVRRHVYAALLSLACERGGNLEALRRACLNVAAHARWEKDSLAVVWLELQLLGVAAQGANNIAFLHALGSLHRLFEQLPAAWLEGRPLKAIERRMLRTDELLESRSSQQLHCFTLEALEAEDVASMAALSQLRKSTV